MYPKPPLCSVIQKYLSLLLQRFVIGVQVRIGGKQQLYTDKQFLTMDDLPQFYREIDRAILLHHHSLSDSYVFLSTDNEEVIHHFQKRYGYSLVTTTEFAIGHSAPNKNYAYSLGASTHMQRAVVDLLLLQRADVLLVTHESSFGQLAVALQSNRHSPIRTFDYLDASVSGECNVFERSTRPFHSLAISPNATVRAFS